MKLRCYDLTGDGAFHVSRSLRKEAFVVLPRRSLWRRVLGLLLRRRRA